MEVVAAHGVLRKFMMKPSPVFSCINNVFTESRALAVALEYFQCVKQCRQYRSEGLLLFLLDDYSKKNTRQKSGKQHSVFIYTCYIFFL